MKNSLPFLAYCTIVQGLWPDFGVTLKIHNKSNFDWNKFKLFTQHKNMFTHQKKNIKMKNSLLAIFDEIPCCTIVHSSYVHTQIMRE